MLDYFDGRGGTSRRAFLRVGALGLGGLTLADLVRVEAKAVAGTSGKSIIMVCLPGGPSHIDMYDMKPDAPIEIRGEDRRAGYQAAISSQLALLGNRVGSEFEAEIRRRLNDLHTWQQRSIRAIADQLVEERVGLI